MKVVLTGAEGLIGRHLAAALTPAHEVWPLTRAQAALPPRADAVVHLAQSRHYPDFPEHALDVFNVNLALTARLLDWSRSAGVRHFVLASTGGVDQTARSYYVATKAAAEQFAQCYATHFAVLVMRFHFVYGPGQRASMLVPRLIDAIREGRAIPLAGDDGPRLTPTYVADAVQSIAAALDRGVSGTIAVAGPEALTVRRMCELIGARLGVAPAFSIDSTRPPQDLVADTAEMTARLGAPRWSFADAIAGMLPERQ
jgi:UDP-glucose 4-epimerase